MAKKKKQKRNLQPTKWRVAKDRARRKAGLEKGATWKEILAALPKVKR